MAPIVQPIARSDSKVRFMTCLGLDISKRLHRQVYNTMKLEANEGRRRIIARLDEQARRNGQSAARTTYSTSQIDESIMNSEAAWIYEHAQSVTRPLYHLGQDPEHPNKPNWVIRWMLWHVIRYKDGRQKNSSTQLPAKVDPSNASGASTTSDSPDDTDGDDIPSQQLRQYYDPVREMLLPLKESARPPSLRDHSGASPASRT